MAAAAAVVVALSAVAVVVVRSSAQSESGKHPAGGMVATATITAAGTHVAIADGVGLPTTTAALAPRASATYRITPSGPLARPAVVTIPLLRRVSTDGLTVVFTSESPQGPWTPLPTRILRGGTQAEVTVTHLSFFETVTISWQEALRDLKQFFNDFTGGAYTDAQPPSCSGESAARQDGYSVAASSGDTMLWCFGANGNGQRVLETVNNRRYPLLVPRTMPLVGGGTGGDVFQLAARLLSFDGVVVYPREEADFGATIPADRWVRLTADLGAEAQLLSSLHTGVSALFSIITRFGATDDPTKVMKVVDTMLTADACRASAGSIAAMLANCLSPYQIAQGFGFPWSVVLAPVAAVSGVADYFHGALNGLADSFDGRTRYALTVTHAQPALPTIDAFLGQWNVHDGGLCVGEALDLAAAPANGNAPCSGSGHVGWMSAWMGCNSPNGGTPICDEWWSLTITDSGDGTITATVNAPPVYTTYNNQVVAGYHDPYPSLEQGDTFRLAKVDTGLLETTWLHTTGSMAGGNPYWCNYQQIGAANRPKCGA